MHRASASETRSSSLALRGFKLVHFLVSIGLFAVCWIQFHYGRLSNIPIARPVRYDGYVIILFGCILFFFNKTYNSYLLGFSRCGSLVFSQIIAQLFSVCATYALVTVAWLQIKDPTVLFMPLPVYLLFDYAWSWAADRLFLRLNPRKRAVLLYGGAEENGVMSFAGKPMDRLFSIEERIFCSSENMDGVIERLGEYDTVFARDISSECINALSQFCVDNDVCGYFIPNTGDIIFRGAYHIQSFSEPVLTVRRRSPNPEYLIIKRCFDVFASLMGIIILSPLMLITALAIRLYDGGPALYKQVRLTKDGREFTILKFRSMRTDAEKDGKARLSTGEKDDRITPVGRIIRACRLDELPQLFNILSGDMTIVGPRPERPEIAEQYYEQYPDFRLRLQVEAGLTGYAQVYGKYNTDPESKLKFDLMYINDMSVITDIRLMFATIRILFDSESTEGIAESQMTAMNRR